ncbi:branched-chain amino acid ABC transporter permease [Candidatus Atribacteria bacterium HGW-Atribacteria-1]|nr:MAG: branched-chain amino acid ABC transporter permease [Candidatus Atribacteria bacterium HGW-Atribacteria-1]
MKNWEYIVLIAIIILFVAVPFFTGPYILHVTTTILTFLSLALSWDMMLRTGQLSFGTAGFFGIGGYTAVLVYLIFNMNPLLSIIVGGIFAAIIAFILGFAILRLRGIYFAITTLALSGVFMVIIKNLSNITGGAEGTILPSAIFNGNPIKIYWLTLVIAIITIIGSELFQKTKIYFAITSTRNDEIVAKSSGIDIFRYLVFVFVITSAIQGIIGGAYAQQYGFVSPESTFSTHFLLLPIAMCLAGGLYSTIGSVVGAVLLGIIAEYLKMQFPYGHLIIYGVIIVLVVLLMPRGIAGTIKDILKKRR